MNRSVAWWLRMGKGNRIGRAGWSYPWASILMSRTGHTSQGVNTLHKRWRIFVNIGRGTLHDADVSGASSAFSQELEQPAFYEPK